MKELDDELIDSLHEGKPLDDMLNLILQFKQRGVSQRAVYDKLMAIWMQFDCGEGTETCPRCVQVEALLEIVCARRPSKYAIWESALPIEPEA